MRQPSTSNPEVPTVVRGGGVLKNSFQTSSKAVEVREIGQEHLRLQHLVERAAGGGEGLLQIVEDVAGLLLDVGAIERKRRILFSDRGNAAHEIAPQLAR